MIYVKVKDQGQVFTPKHIVEDILDIAGYHGEEILKKHVIDNSCGDGAFLIGFITRYMNEYITYHGSKQGLNQQLKRYIHGIEKDPDIFQRCLVRLNRFASEHDLGKIKWDITQGDSLMIDRFDGKMDYVIGNPPYVRVHNLKEQYNKVKESSFCETGMTDLYILFFEIGLRMLKKKGILCYITPNSFCNSVAGSGLRRYLKKHQNMELLCDLGHYQPFRVMTYTMISKICNNKKFDYCKYYKYNKSTEKKEYICDISYQNLFIDEKLVLSKNNDAFSRHLTYKINQESKVQVKNGFATLNDHVFIQDDFPFQENIIDVIKGSTGQWKKCIYPYDQNGKLIPFEKLSLLVQTYLLEKQDQLTKEKNKKIDSLWYGFGRSQAIGDVSSYKIAINTTIKDCDSIKLNEVKPGQGIYSGLYILTKVPIDVIKEIICSEKFIDYLKMINKCKSGGYFTFSSKDLSKFINCELEEYYE